MSLIVSKPDGRTRIKLCGLTREQDVDAAVALGVDAIGLNFYAHSPRYVSIEQAARLVARVPASVTAVGLFVNASSDTINAVLDAVPLSLLQFHGDETPEQCSGFRVPYMKAARMTSELDLLRFADTHHEAVALLLDAHTAGYGGSGKVFDWSLVPPQLLDTAHRFSAAPARVPRVVLSGGLNAANVADAIRSVRPYAVDTSSGAERDRKGIKDPAVMRAFVAAVRAQDQLSS
jgi:phosphoribosylanthranilate isomerase